MGNQYRYQMLKLDIIDAMEVSANNIAETAGEILTAIVLRPEEGDVRTIAV